MIEKELRFLAKKLPDLTDCKSKEIIDLYIPITSKHPILRVRKNGTNFEMTKSEPLGVDGTDLQEYTIPLKDVEWDALSKLEAKKVHKVRYYYEWKDHTIEIDVFQEELKGLVIMEVEFETDAALKKFRKPAFFGARITDERLAGGMLCGKKYKDIKVLLDAYEYVKLKM